MDTSGGAAEAAHEAQQEVLAPLTGVPTQAEAVPAALTPAIAIPLAQLTQFAAAVASTAIPRPSQAPAGLPLQDSPALAAAPLDDELEDVTIAINDAYEDAEQPRSCS